MKALSRTIIVIFAALIMLAFCASFAHAANTPCHGYELQNTGSNSGTWGVKVNNVFSTIDKNFGGLMIKDVSGNSDVIVSAADAQNVYQQMTGTITGSFKYILPNTCGLYIIDNQTTGAYTITAVNTVLGTGVVIPTGQKAFVYSNSATSTITLASDLTSGILPPANGGTGNGFTKFSGPATSEKTFTLPNANATILTDNAVVTVAQGGTGQTTFSSAFNAFSPLTTKGDILVFNSAGTNARMPVGTDGYSLVADSTTSTGLSYKAQVTPGILGASRNLKIISTGATNTSAIITAEEISLEDSANNYFTARIVNVTANSASSGANGLDSGSSSSNTWYYVYVIYNPTTTTIASLLSTSASSPTLPSGYTYKARVGTVRTDSTGNKYLLQTIQYGNKVQYVVLSGSNVARMPLMAAGPLGSISTPTWSVVAVSNYVPTAVASTISLVISQSGNGATIVAPNNSYGAFGSATNPPITAPPNTGTTLINMVLESTNIFFAAQSSDQQISCSGWTENL